MSGLDSLVIVRMLQDTSHPHPVLSPANQPAALISANHGILAMSNLSQRRRSASVASENPYSTPKAEDPALGGDFDAKTPAHLTFRVLAWTLWTALAANLLWNLTGMLSHGPLVPNLVGGSRLIMLTLIVIAQVAMVIFMRWIVFRLVMRNVNPVDWRGAARCAAGAVTLYGMIQVLGIVGVRVGAESGRLSLYLCFASPGFILAALFNPHRLGNYVFTGKNNPTK